MSKWCNWTSFPIGKSTNHSTGEWCIISVLTADCLLRWTIWYYPNIRLLTLCRPEERGYLHKAFSHKSPKSRQEAIVRLLISVDLLLHSRSFVGSITTGPSVFIMKLREDDPFVQAVDCPKTDLASSLSLTIDVRAAISKRFLSHTGSECCEI